MVIVANMSKEKYFMFNSTFQYYNPVGRRLDTPAIQYICIQIMIFGFEQIKTLVFELNFCSVINKCYFCFYYYC